MPHIFEQVTGSDGALSFQFNGQFALKNYNVEIINGNRLKVVSNTNEMFSLLEAEVSEVEINGQIYSDANAAQLALQTLVYSNAKPVVLTEEMYLKLGAAVQAADRGQILPDTPMPVGGWLVGWYTAGLSSTAPGTNYPNQNNLKADENYLTKFYFNGTTWVLQKDKKGKPALNVRKWEDLQPTDFPLTAGSQVIYEDGHWIINDGQTASSTDLPSDLSTIWKSIGGNDSKINQIINDRFGVPISGTPQVATYTQDDGTPSTSLKINNTNPSYADASARTILNIPLNGALNINISGYFLNVSAQNNIGLLGIKSNGDKVDLSASLADYFQNVNTVYDVSLYEMISAGMAGDFSIQVFEEVAPPFPAMKDYFALKTDVQNIFAGKKIMWAGDSRTSTDYSFIASETLKKTNALNVYSGGFSGYTTAQLASNVCLQRIFDYAPDFMAFLGNGNDTGAAGTIGTFSNTSELFAMGETVVTETNINNEYNGTKLIQAMSHIIRRIQKEYKNFRANASLTGSENEAERDAKIEAVLKPIIFICTDMPQKNFDSNYVGSQPISWERKRLAVIECCEKYNFPYLDLQKILLENWDWTLEPYFLLPTDKINNKGLYTMDGLHHNKYGWRFMLTHMINKFKDLGNPN